MLSQFYLDPVIMSKENERKFPFKEVRDYEFQRSVSKLVQDTTKINLTPSKNDVTLNKSHVINGNDVTKSNIDFLKNLSENILVSVKTPERERSDICDVTRQAEKHRQISESDGDDSVCLDGFRTSDESTPLSKRHAKNNSCNTNVNSKERTSKSNERNSNKYDREPNSYEDDDERYLRKCDREMNSHERKTNSCERNTKEYGRQSNYTDSCEHNTKKCERGGNTNSCTRYTDSSERNVKSFSSSHQRQMCDRQMNSRERNSTKCAREVNSRDRKMKSYDRDESKDSYERDSIPNKHEKNSYDGNCKSYKRREKNSYERSENSIEKSKNSYERSENSTEKNKNSYERDYYSYEHCENSFERDSKCKRGRNPCGRKTNCSERDYNSSERDNDSYENNNVYERSATSSYERSKLTSCEREKRSHGRFADSYERERPHTRDRNVTSCERNTKSSTRKMDSYEHDTNSCESDTDHEWEYYHGNTNSCDRSTKSREQEHNSNLEVFERCANSFERRTERDINKYPSPRESPNNNGDITEDMMIPPVYSPLVSINAFSKTKDSLDVKHCFKSKRFHNGRHNSARPFISSTLESCSSTTTSSSSESTEGEGDDEWKRLNSVLSHVDPYYLVEYLTERIKNKDADSLRHLSTLLPRESFSGETSHCVRCHQHYDGVHGTMECVLPHREKDVEVISQDNDCALFQCERCFGVFKLHGEFKYTKENADKCGLCFTGSHTTKVDEVEYEPAGAASRCVDSGCNSVTNIFFV